MGHMFFSPNLTGPLHIGSGIVLWLTAKEAAARGCTLVICFDEYPNSIDVPGHSRPKPTMDNYILTMDSTKRACEALGIEGYRVHRRSQYVQRYEEVFLIAQERDLICEITPTEWIARPEWEFARDDAVLGPCSHPATRVAHMRLMHRTFYTLVDFWDFDIPMHIRGQDILNAMWGESRMWPLMCKILGERPPMQYAHIPVIARADGSPIHKSDPTVPGELRNGLSGDPYSFDVWADGYDTPQERRDALERIILHPGLPWAWSNVYGQALRNVLYDPETRTATSYTGANVYLRYLERHGQWRG